MKSIFPLLLLLTGLFVSGCGPQVTTAQPTNADLSSYSTFAYLPNADIKLRNDSMDQDMVNTRVIETVNIEMEKQGYQLDRDNPDLLVLINVYTEQDTSTSEDPVYASYPYGTYGITRVSPYYNNFYYNGFASYGGVVGYDRDTREYTEGTLIISLVDRMSKKTVWKGMTSKAIYSGSTTDEIVKLVDNIFDEYPMTRGRAK